VTNKPYLSAARQQASKRHRRWLAERRAAEAEEYARALAAEAEASLRQDPERWKWAAAGDPDEHRRKPRRATGRRAGR
jgi:hypothetical protein